MGTHRLDRRAVALLALALLGPAACSADASAPVLQSSVTLEAPDDASSDEPLTFVAPDRSSNAALGLTADGPERTDVHGTYHQAAIADDSPLFDYPSSVVSPDLEQVFSAEEVAQAHRAAVTYLVREYIDSELVADTTDATRAAVQARLRSEFSTDPFWDTELAPALEGADCTYLVDCTSTTRDPSRGHTLRDSDDLRFILTDFATKEIYLGENDTVVVDLSAAYRRELDVPGQDHAFETTTTNALYGLTTDGSSWFIDGWEVEADSLDVGALVEGGQPALPVLDGVDWGTVPTGFSAQDFERVSYGLGPSWEPGGDEMWSWYGDDSTVVYESFVGPELDATRERADFAVMLVPKKSGVFGGMADAEWTYPLDGASYRLDVPGADSSTGEFRPVSYDDRERVDIWVEDGSRYLWFVTYADAGEGEAALRELAQTITVP